MNVIDDINRLGEICHAVGYLGAIADDKYNDGLGSDLSDTVVKYIAELFNAKRVSITSMPEIDDWQRTHTTPYPFGTEVTTGTPLPKQDITITCVSADMIGGEDK